MKEVYDVETMINVFTYCGKDTKTLQESEFIIHRDRNDIDKLYDHLELLTGQIGFNNLSFDGQVIQFILNSKTQFAWMHVDEIIDEIYSFAQKCIQTSNSGGWSEFAEWTLKIPQLDLFKIWHFDNKAKMTSLKWIEYMIDMHSIEEMPIHHSVPVSLEEVVNKIIPYNRHDVNATFEFYKITKGDTELSLYKGVNKIELRKNISAEFGFNAMNFNDVKIGDMINKLSYCKLTGLHKKEIPSSTYVDRNLYFKDCFPEYMNFKTEKFQNFIHILGNTKVDFDKKQEFSIEHNGTTYIIAKGGIHSKDKGRCIIPTDKKNLRDADIGLMWSN